MVIVNFLNNCRGQVAVLYALLVPIFLFLGGVGLDLGWYYLNVSRLQNAADAAVLAGANELIETNPDAFKGYEAKLVDKFPADSSVNTTRSGYEINMTAGNEAALDYAKKNLSDNSTAYAPPSFFSVAQAAEFKDGYTRGNPTVTLTPSLYKDNDDDYYYVVGLSEDIHHFFIGFLDDMKAPVVAVAMISKDAVSDVVPKVVFDANGGQIKKRDGSSTSTVELGKLDKRYPVVIKLPDGYEPDWENHSFVEWNTKRDGTGDAIRNKNIVNKEKLREFFEKYDPHSGNPGYNYRKEGVVTLYAIWNNTPQPKIIFDANGGTFKDGSTTDSKNFKAADSMKDDEESEPLEPNKDKGVPTHSDELKIFKGWTTEKYKDANADEVIDIYLNGDQLTKQQVKELFNGKDTVVLYAVWEKVKPSNNRTLWEQMQYLIAKNVYNDYWYAAKAKYGSNPKNSPFVYKAVYKKNWSSGSYQTIKHQNNEKWTDSYGISRTGGTEYVLNGKHYNEPSERLYYVEANTLDKNTINGTERYYIDFLQTHDGNIKVPEPERRASGIIPNGGGYTTDKNGVRHYYNRYFGFEGHYYGNVCRVHSLINVNDTYDVRSSHKKNGEKIDDDPIYFRIEAEPYISERTPIRQIVININADNTPDLKRPLFFFYDGPDARTTLKDDGTGQKILNPAAAQPVILNLNADFKGVLWMPNIPVVINGNGHKFEGFIIAKEYRYLDTTQGMQVKYSSKGETDKEYSDNKIRIYTDSTEEDLTINKHLVGDVYTKKATGTNARDTYNKYATETKDGFNLSSESKFRTFKAETKVNFTYIYYDYNDEPEMDKSPFYDYSNPDTKDGVDKGTLVPLYKLDAEGNQVRILNWNDVKLYNKAPEYKRNSEGKPSRDENGNMIITNGAIEIPKKITTTDLNKIKALAPGNSEIQKATSVAKFKGIVLLDEYNNPREVYDEAGNPVYFCKSYVKVRDQYDIFTLNKMDDTADTVGEGMRSSKEFLLTADTTNISSDDNVSDTDDWK